MFKTPYIVEVRVNDYEEIIGVMQILLRAKYHCDEPWLK